MRSLLATFGLLLLLLLGCAKEESAVAAVQPKWIEYGIVPDPARKDLAVTAPFPYFGEQYSATEVVQVETPLRRCRVERATASVDPLGRPAVSIRVDRLDAPDFEAFTAANLHREMVIIVDGRVASKAEIGARLPGEFQIFGMLTEADRARILKSLQ
jgi:preprotein translocase subunit SecD